LTCVPVRICLHLFKKLSFYFVKGRTPKNRRPADVFPVDKALLGGDFFADQKGHHSHIGSSIAQNYVAQEPDNEVVYLFSKLNSPFE